MFRSSYWRALSVVMVDAPRSGVGHPSPSQERARAGLLPGHFLRLACAPSGTPFPGRHPLMMGADHEETPMNEGSLRFAACISMGLLAGPIQAAEKAPSGWVVAWVGS